MYGRFCHRSVSGFYGPKKARNKPIAFDSMGSTNAQTTRCFRTAAGLVVRFCVHCPETTLLPQRPRGWGDRWRCWR